MSTPLLKSYNTIIDEIDGQLRIINDNIEQHIEPLQRYTKNYHDSIYKIKQYDELKEKSIKLYQEYTKSNEDKKKCEQEREQDRNQWRCEKQGYKRYIKHLTSECDRNTDICINMLEARKSTIDRWINACKQPPTTTRGGGKFEESEKIIFNNIIMLLHIILEIKDDTNGMLLLKKIEKIIKGLKIPGQYKRLLKKYKDGLKTYLVLVKKMQGSIKGMKDILNP